MPRNSISKHLATRDDLFALTAFLDRLPNWLEELLSPANLSVSKSMNRDADGVSFRLNVLVEVEEVLRVVLPLHLQ